jgi:hypothetical protein
MQGDLPATPGLLGLNTGANAGSFMFQRGLEDLAEDSFMHALIKAGMPGIFALHLCPSGGFLWLGGYDRNHVAARKVPQYAPIIPLWPPTSARRMIVQVLGISVGGAEAVSTVNMSNVVYVDTGNRFLELPPRHSRRSTQA